MATQGEGEGEGDGDTRRGEARRGGWRRHLDLRARDHLLHVALARRHVREELLERRHVGEAVRQRHVELEEAVVVVVDPGDQLQDLVRAEGLERRVREERRDRRVEPRLALSAVTYGESL